MSSAPVDNAAARIKVRPLTTSLRPSARRLMEAFLDTGKESVGGPTWNISKSRNIRAKFRTLIPGRSSDDSSHAPPHDYPR